MFAFTLNFVYRYDEAAAAAKCSTGCERSINYGNCSAKSTVGGSCATSGDCYNDMACIGGVCCAFSQQNYAFNYEGLSNCTACSSVNGECSSCKPGAALTTTPGWDTSYRYMSSFHAVSSEITGCLDVCDPTTEFRGQGSRYYYGQVLTYSACWKKASPGEACYAQWWGCTS